MTEETRILHPIGVAATRTGLSPSVLRAWERRYAAVEPQRSPGGQRLYSSVEIERLRLLRAAVDGGRSIGQVAGVPTSDLRALVQEDQRFRVGEAEGRVPPPGKAGTSGREVAGEGFEGGEPGAGRAEGIEPRAKAEGLVRSSLDAVEALDPQGLVRLLQRAAVSLDPVELVDHVLAPLLHGIGALWEEGVLSPADERLASGSIASFLRRLLDTLQTDGDAPVMVTATPAGEHHELGSLLAAAAGAAAGWRVVALGPNLPPEDVAGAAERAGARLVAISVVEPAPESERVESQLRRLRNLLPADVRIVVGGAGASTHREALALEGAEVTTDLARFRAQLLSPNAGNPTGSSLES